MEISLRYDFTTLKLFLAVVRHGSIARAAHKENIAPSAISKRVGELEQSVGVPLLHRLPNGVRLTEAGNTLARHANAVMLSLERMKADLSEYAEGVKGEIRIQSNASAIATSLACDLRAFSNAHPHVALHLQESGSPAIIRAVSDGDVDIGIYAANVEAPNLQIFHYRTINLMLVVPGQHPLSKHEIVDFSQTLDYDYVGLHESNSLSSLTMTSVLAENAVQRVRVQARSFEALRKLVEAGVGITIIPDCNCVPYSAIQNIHCIQLNDSWAKLNINICAQNVSSLPVAARLLIKHLSPNARMSGDRQEPIGKPV